VYESTVYFRSLLSEDFILVIEEQLITKIHKHWLSCFGDRRFFERDGGMGKGVVKN